MDKLLITDEMRWFLKNEEFLYIGTCNPDGRPNVAPKFLIKAVSDHVYLADFVIGKTYANIKNNPNVSVSVVNMDTLEGYILHGMAQIVEKGEEYEEILEELDRKQIHFSASRIIEGVQKEKRHTDFELTFPKNVSILKIKVDEVVKIHPSGKLEKSK